jgi:hypothetical protein
VEKQLCTASDTTVVAAGDKHSPAAVAPFWQVFVVMTGYFSVGYGLWMYWTVWRAQGMPPVRLRNQSYRGRVIWPDDGTFSSVAAKGE